MDVKKNMNIYTRTGDAGQTSLVGGVRVPKTHPRLAAYGTIDELTSNIGLLAALLRQDGNNSYEHRLTDIQSELFNVGSALASEKPKPLDMELVTALERDIDALSAELPPWRGFILPGGTVAASQAHVCRTVCRRAERHIFAMIEALNDPAAADIYATQVAYVNRLSDYLFTLARHINSVAGQEDIIWRRRIK